jgi:competence protein ComFB
MSLTDRYDVQALRNRTAEAVYERVERLLAGGDALCPCGDCVVDLVAFVLNRVTPRYTTSALGNLHLDPAEERRLAAELDGAIEAGLARLRAHPHHE